MQSVESTPAASRHRAVTCLIALASGVLLCRVPSAGLDSRWIFLASILVFGLAHGACDVWLPGWVRKRTIGWGVLSIFCLAYLGLAGGVLLLWRVLPGGALAGFLVLTAWHWGSADAMLTGSGSWRFHLLAWGRGLMVLAAPGAFHPQAAFQVLGTLCPAFTVLSSGRLHAVTVAVLIVGVSTQGMIWPQGAEDRRLIGHHLETLFLLGLFAALAPLTATALYFVWFHAWRHILRLCRWQSPGVSDLWLCLGRFHLAALPCILGAVGLLWWVARRWPGDLLRAYLILLSAVTLPHALLVWWLDRVETRRRASDQRQILPAVSATRWVSLAL